jgi:hypothetical protein
MCASRTLRAAVMLAPLAVLGACRTTRVEEPAGMQLAQPAQLEPARAWRVVDQGQTLGIVVQFEMANDPGSTAHHYYSVRNRLEQELGSIDALGRAWRFEVHQRDARLVATGTLLQGACAILGAAGAAQLVEEPLDTLRGGATGR